MSHKTPSPSVTEFYDSLSDEYHFVYADWHRSIQRQSKILTRLIKEYAGPDAKTVWDCACGIGTQALGLAQAGFEVYATDISAKSIQRAQQESQKLNLSLTFDTADFKDSQYDVGGPYDVVISCDNALPHLLTDDELVLAGENILSKMNPEGIFLGSIRDYDVILKDKPTVTSPVTSIWDGKRVITFQTWEWRDDNTYLVNHFTLKEQEEKFNTTLRKTVYRAYTREEISTLFYKTGFKCIKWLMPEESRFYQPILIGKK